MAAIVLWERLAPDVANTETLDDMIQQGYDLVESQREPEGCAIWLKVWEQLKTQLTPEPKSIRDIDKVFNGSVFLSDWLSDLEMELHNAGLQDRTFFEKRVEYSRELYTLFPKSDSLTLLNAKRAEAESLFSLGKAEEGERAFEALIKEFPDSAWGYIGWGDMYGPFRTNEETELNFDKAEKIYRLGLGRATEDRDVIQDRLEDLEEEKKKHLSAQ